MNSSDNIYFGVVECISIAGDMSKTLLENLQRKQVMTDLALLTEDKVHRDAFTVPTLSKSHLQTVYIHLHSSPFICIQPKPHCHRSKQPNWPCSPALSTSQRNFGSISPKTGPSRPGEEHSTSTLCPEHQLRYVASKHMKPDVFRRIEIYIYKCR